MGIDILILINAIVGVISAGASSTITWLLARKKYNSEVDNTLIENMLKSLDFYKKLSDDNKERLEEILQRNDVLEEEVRTLRNQMVSLMESICINLTCKHRVKGEEAKKIKSNLTV